MDSKAYFHFLVQIRKEIEVFSPELPHVFATEEPDLIENTKMRQNIGLLLQTFIAQPNTFLPESVLPDISDNIFRESLLNSLKNIHAFLSSPTHESPTPKGEVRHFLHLLLHSTTPQGSLLFSAPDARLYSLLVFLSEAIMHCGWCPNSLEPQGKRAAHIFFVQLKKSFHRVAATEISTVYCFLLGAWFLAQKTEGIRDHRLDTEQNDISAVYPFSSANQSQHIFLFYQFRPRVFYLLKKGSSAHPFSYIHTNYSSLGLTLYGTEGRLTFTETRDPQDIQRKHMQGRIFFWKSPVGDDRCLFYKQVFITYQNTLYRIDVLKNSSEYDIPLHAVTLTIESSPTLKKSTVNTFTDQNIINTVVHFIENPFGFDLSSHESTQVTFTSPKAVQIKGKETVQIITGISRGKGITDINRTNLLGIYDL